MLSLRTIRCVDYKYNCQNIIEKMTACESINKIRVCKHKEMRPNIKRFVLKHQMSYVV